jgi:hypothetical protein
MNKLLLTAIACMTIGGAATAQADYFTTDNWTTTASNGFATVTAAYNDVTFAYGYATTLDAGVGGQTWTFSTIAPITGTIGFDWTQSVQYAFNSSVGSFTVSDPTQSFTLDTAAGNTGIAAGTNRTLNVNAGDTITFTANMSNFDSQPSVSGSVELTAFTGDIPEPVSMALLGVGVAGLGLVRRHKAG